MTGSDLPASVRGKYPHGVPFNMLGFPDFSRYAVKKVNVGSFNNDDADFRAANDAAFGANNGFGSKAPPGYRWHHTQYDGRLQLIPADIHDAVRHTGGAAVCGTRR
ncbi:hypothetical protein D3C86_1226900 [compost metagenome]